MSHYHRFALVGDPVEHSRSPIMHREALRLSGLEGDYELIKADRGVLEEVVDRLREGSLDGVNVTMPLKGDAFEIADVVTGEAEASVNTLRSRDGRVEGHSTDVVAFENIFTGVSAPLLVLGSGGSARAALTAWAHGPVSISARNSEMASELAKRHDAGVVGWGVAVPGAVVVNATPLGMAGESIPSAVLDGASVLIDLPYGPEVTPATKRAGDLGLSCVDGLEFLGIQAAASFTWWTGVPVDSARLVGVARNV